MVDTQRSGNHPHLGRVTDSSGYHLSFPGRYKRTFEQAVLFRFVHRLGLTGECGFIGRQVIGRRHPAVSGYCVTSLEQDKITDYDVAGGNRYRPTVPYHLD